MMAFWLTLVPVAAAILGAAVAVNTRPGSSLVSAVQHFAAGVVFAAAAAEVLPDLMHYGSPVATLVGGAVGVALMLLLMQMKTWLKGPVGLLAATGVDLLVDGLVLGIAFTAGAKAGFLLTVALTLEVLFLGLAIANELGDRRMSKVRIVAITGALMLLLPLGGVLAAPVASLPGPVVAGFLAFGLMALLYLVTEELLVEAHVKPDSPLITATFFVGFLAVLILDQVVG
ncbi:ZIP family metal transporter [Lichenifustis flavocetrariae]|uniref:Transporter n=1 Tax=Lichenifustis flavocetrariae TaxID=2949735 RepID=A0AA41Z3B1_9HYPH|nr:transporter [Lichenifustis flavocetrariae]MCW6512247.1 transporter [Lichenifustis flavocetrariae]